MIEWSDEQLMVRDAVRDFVQSEIVPNRDDLEHGDRPPYDILRSYVKTFGIDEMNRERVERETRGGPPATPEERYDRAVMTLLPMVEICRQSPGLVTAMGVSMNLAGNAITRRGTAEQRERWGIPLVTMERIGSWAITEPGSGSDAFGAMRSTAVRDGDGYVLNGSKTFITNGPYADTIVFICKLDDGTTPARERQVLNVVVESGTPGLVQTKPLRKMGMHSSPTGELFLDDVRVTADHVIGGPGESRGAGPVDAAKRAASRQSAKAAFASERASVAAMALGIIEQCLEVSVAYAKERVQFGQPINSFQLIQAKLAAMEVARMNVQNMVFRYLETMRAGKSLSFAEASAMKLYSARSATEVALEAVQLFGGNGYMSEFHVEQLARDAKVLQIYAGTDELQIVAIAKDLNSR
ncbi:MAG: acyl-CoA dehydrogenase family protein [Ilumatobacteraceae bacterium]